MILLAYVVEFSSKVFKKEYLLLKVYVPIGLLILCNIIIEQKSVFTQYN